jgi:hypothetical protein
MPSRRPRFLEIFQIFIAIASLMVPAVGWTAESACVPHSWTATIVDPDVVDVDSYVAATSIFLNDHGRAMIFYGSGPLGFNEWRLKQGVERGGGWRVRRLPANPGDPRPSVAMDSSGTPHIAWRTGVFFGEGILNYAKVVNGVWQEEIVDDTPGGTSYVSIAVDAGGFPHIVYSGELAGMPMRYARWDGTTWQKEDVSFRGGILSPSLVLDAAGDPHVAYIVGTGSEIDYAVRSGGVWSSEPIDVIPAGQQTLEASLALDSSGQPHVAYDELFDVGMHYAVKDASGWSSIVIDPGQRWDPALVVDSNDVPHMVFYDAEHGALIYASKTSGAWCVETVEDDASDLIRIGRNPNLVVDDAGRIHVSYHYHDFNAACQVKYAVSAP